MILEVPPHLSHSQSDNLVGPYCPASVFYGRYLGMAERPGWAQLGGSALHEASEAWDWALIEDGEADDSPERLDQLFKTAFDKQIAEREQDTTYPRSEWYASGREIKTKFTMDGGPSKKDEAWWRRMGPEMLRFWTAWRLTSPWEIAVLDEQGRTRYGIELAVSTDFGGRPWRGYIDRVFHRRDPVTDSDEYLLVDLKSGKEPDGAAQNGAYRVALLRQYGIDAKWGAFWLGGTGTSTSLVNLREQWPEEKVEFRYAKADAVRMAGAFVHRPSNMCRSCSVNAYCAEFGGEKAASTPQPWDVTEVRIADAA